MPGVTVRMKGDDAAELLLYDVIGEGSLFEPPGVSAKAFRAEVQKIKGRSINLRINSPGGSVTEGAAMLAALDQWKGAAKGRGITADVDGLAASAASFVMMAADEVRVASNALVMIHNPHTIAAGEAGDMRRAAELLDKVREQILDAYERHSKAGRTQLGAWMDAETWFTGAEAVGAGLAHSVTGAVPVAAFAGHKDILAKLGARKVPPLPASAADARAMEETRRRMEIAARL